jgi:hypothetical protein
MIALAYTPTRIYNTTEKKPTERKQKHWRQYASGISPRKTGAISHNYGINPKIPPAVHETPCKEKDTRIKELEEENRRYKVSYKKMQLLASLNLRSNKSAIKDINNIIDIMEDLYGETAFEDGL